MAANTTSNANKARLKPCVSGLRNAVNCCGPCTSAQVLNSFAPAAFLILLVLGSIFAGWATPTEAGGVGAFGSILLAIKNRQFNLRILREVMYSAATTNALVFFIIFGATLFSYVFRALGGDDIVLELLKTFGIDTGWEVLIFVMALPVAWLTKSLNEIVAKIGFKLRQRRCGTLLS